MSDFSQCDALLDTHGVSSYLLQKVQSVQNAAARLITGTRPCERITPVLQKLHWLPVRRRIQFKLACLVHQSLAGQTPSYHGGL